MRSTRSAAGACGLLALVGALALPGPGQAAVPGEELLDADGYQGLRPGIRADEAAWARRFGPPDDVESQGGPRPFRRLLWGISLSEVEEIGLPLTGMELHVELGAQGWTLTQVVLGAQRQPTPLVHGHPLAEAEAVEASLPGALALGKLLLACPEGLELGPPEDGSPGRFGLLTWTEPRLPGLLRRTQALAQALTKEAWPLPAPRLQALRELASAEGELPLVLVPARVLGLGPSPEGPSFGAWRLRLAAHARCEGLPPLPGAAAGAPSQELSLSLPREGSLGRTQVGDRVLLQAEWVQGLQEGPGGPIRWWLRSPRPLMAFPSSQPFPHPELWQGLPEPQP